MPRKHSKKRKKTILQPGGIVTRRKTWDTGRFNLKGLPKTSISSGTTVEREMRNGEYIHSKKRDRIMLFHFINESQGNKSLRKKKPKKEAKEKK